MADPRPLDRGRPPPRGAVGGAARLVRRGRRSDPGPGRARDLPVYPARMAQVGGDAPLRRRGAAAVAGSDPPGDAGGVTIIAEEDRMLEGLLSRWRRARPDPKARWMRD